MDAAWCPDLGGLGRVHQHRLLPVCCLLLVDGRCLVMEGVVGVVDFTSAQRSSCVLCAGADVMGLDLLLHSGLSGTGPAMDMYWHSY
jgi:hypothetical protein